MVAGLVEVGAKKGEIGSDVTDVVLTSDEMGSEEMPS